MWVKSPCDAPGSLAAVGFVLKVRGRQGSGVLWLVGHLGIIGDCCVKYVLIVGGGSCGSGGGVWSLWIFMREWGGFYRVWLLVDVWSIMFQTGKMKNQDAEYYLQAWELI